MLVKTPTHRRLAALGTACLLSVALPAMPAWAQKTKTKDPAPAETSTSETDTGSAATSDFSVNIPTIDAAGSNVDEATLREIFNGNIVDNAEALAGLTATSITIPEITLTGSTTLEGETATVTIAFNDLVLNDVTDGIAASVTLGSTTSESEEGNAELGSLTASNFDIGGVLGLYGLVPAEGSAELETIYTDFSFEGGSFSGSGVECTIGTANVGELKARPLNYSFAEIMALADAMEQADEELPDPKTTGDALRMYVDLLTSFETSPVTFDGFQCSGVDEEDQSFTFNMAGLSMGAMSPGYYPEYAVEGLEMSVDGDGQINLGNFTFKGMDISGPIAAIQGAPEAIDDLWFAENARSLIPAFEGFSFSDVSVDIPDPEAPNERIVGGIGAFDLTLSDYLNGIPTSVSTTASNIVADIPADSADPQLAQLLALGVTSIDLGFALKAAWNEAEDKIDLTEFSVSGADLATVKLAGTFANATEDLFGIDNDAALAAAMGVVISNLNLDVTDQGLSDIILASVATEQGSDAATMRPVFAGLAEGTVVGILAGAAEAQKVGAAINSFVSGKAKNLSIDMVAKEQPGLGIDDFMAAETDPSVLIGKVTINATAK
jgi:hypothetical protein